MAFGSGDGQDVSISINGDSGGAQNAIQQATQSLKNLTDQMRYSSQATSVFGQAGASSALAWLNSAGSAKDYTQRLSYLQAQLGYTKLAQDQANDSTNGYRFTMQSLGNDLLNNMGTFGATVITLNSLLGVFGAITGAVSDVVGGIGQFVEGLAQVAASDAWQVIQYGADQVERLGQAMFDLNNTTERNVTNWTYLYGGPNGGGTQAAAGLAAWTQQFSMQIPYTRQDLMSAVTTLSAEQGATPSAIERQLSLLSDVASTQGRPGLTLAWAAQAALRASQAGKGSGGSFRMLMMDLNLNKGELAPFGYNENDPGTFWPALEGYEKAKGSYGASKAISTQTFWGAASSFEDRIQNFLLAAGGTNVYGTVQKGSFFGNLKQDLTGVSSWMDAHQAQLKQLSDIVSHLYGGMVQTGTNGLTELLQALHSTGIDTQLLGDLSDFAKWLGEPNTQAGAREIGGLVGRLAGVAGMDLRKVFGSLWNGLTSSGLGQTLLDDIQGATTWLSDPNNQHMLEETGFILGQGIGTSLQTISSTLGNLVANGTQLMQSLRPDDLALIAGAFSEMSLAISATGDSVVFLGRETFDLIHLMEDFNKGDFGAMGQDIGQMSSDLGSYFNSLGKDMANAANQSTQMQVGLAQWQKAHPVIGPHSYGHLGATGGQLHEGDAANVGGGGHVRTASMGASLGRTLTTGVSDGMVGDLSNITRAGRQVMEQFADALINASSGPLAQLGQHIAGVIGDSIQEHMATASRSRTNTTNTPGGLRQFGVRGAGW